VAIGAAILVILVGWVLRATAVVSVPIVFALFLAVVLAPLDREIAARLPRPIAWLGRVAVMAVLLVALTGFFSGLVYSARQVIDEMPRLAGTLERVLPAGVPELDGIGQMMEEGAVPPPSAGEDAGEGEDAGDARVGDSLEGDAAEAETARGDGGAAGAEAGAAPLRDAMVRAGSSLGAWLVEGATGLARQVAGAVGTFVAATIIVVFMVLLALGETQAWHRKLETLWPDASSEWRSAFVSISRKLRGFLLVRAAMGALSAVLYVAWLWLFDVGLLSVWAVLTFLLGFVPNLGSVISGLLPTLYALATKDFQTALLAGLGLFAIEQVIGNFVDPRMQGRQIAISPMVVLVSVLVWGWLWGAAGALLAVPVMLALMVGFAHVPRLEPVALLLSNKTDHDALARALRS
jgi:AI-2 transport protein TqsA